MKISPMALRRKGLVPLYSFPSRTLPLETPVMPGEPGVTAQLGHRRWDLSAADHHDGRTRGQLVIDFTQALIMGPEWGTCLRELAYHRLNTRVPGLPLVSPYTCSREQLRLKRFMKWLQDHAPDVQSPSQMTQGLLHAYRVWLSHHDSSSAVAASGGNFRSTEDASPSLVWSYLSPFKSMDLLRDVLTVPLPFHPYEGRLSAKMVGVVDTDENSTDPLPDAVLQPLIDTSLRYIRTLAPDIFAMRDEMIRFWDRDTASHDFPGWKHVISTPLGEDGPWRTPLQIESRRPQHVFREEAAHLIASCLVMILYLSGMRPGESTRLAEDCVRTTNRQGLPGQRHKIEGLPLKKRGQRNNVLVTWVVIPEVVEAVAMLRDLLAPFREIHGSDRLVLNQDALRSSRGKRPRDYALSTKSLYLMVVALYERVRIEHPEAPAYDIHPSQFRRTLARHIAHQPFGIIAGKLQYNHVSTAVFEGYAGSPDDTFALDVQDERTLAGIDLIEEFRADIAGGWNANQAVRDLVTSFDASQVVIGDAVVDTTPSEARLRASARDLALKVHVGALSYCVFDPANAACLTETERKDAKQPRINQCSPHSCGNAVVRSCHLPRWTALLDEVVALRDDTRAGPKKTALDRAARDYRRVIDRVETE